MATFETNIARIRGDAIYGKDVRAAIAQGLQQADANSLSKINELIERVTTVKDQIDNEEIYVDMTALGNDAWLMEIRS